ncbi:MAG: glucose-6-phosphate dehydrogenase assembly protein OpcA [Gaiellaceae bacterium]
MSALEAHVDEWEGHDVRVADVERELGALRGTDGDGAAFRTSVMTHVAWVPPEWEGAARATLAGFDELYPSRTLLLLPAPGEPDGLDARTSLNCSATAGSRHVCTELVELRLRGARAEAPGSVVAPLLLPDLPVFLRWRGEPTFDSRPFASLAALVDRLVIDSREWTDLPASYARVAKLCSDHLAVSDIVWTRGTPWRAALAALWPQIAEVRTLGVTGPLADALLLTGWLRSRLDRPVALEHDYAGEVEAVAVDGRPVEMPREPVPSQSDLLSGELDRFGRDPVYEAAVRAAGR